MQTAQNSILRLTCTVFVVAVFGSGRGIAHAECVFGKPRNLGAPINTAYSDGTPCISYDGLSLYFTSNRPGGSGMHDLWMASRDSQGAPWSTPVNLGGQVNSGALDYFPCVSADGLELCFYSTRAGGRGGGDLWVSKRSSVHSQWGYASNLGSAINSNWEDVSPHLSSDRLTLLFSSNRSFGYGDYDLYMITRESVGSQWSFVKNLGSTINSGALEAAPSLSSDGLTLFFHSMRGGGSGSYDLYYSRRESLDGPWSTPVNLGSPVNSSYSELGPSISGDGTLLYFSGHFMLTPRPGGLGTDDIWEVCIRPVVDYDNSEFLDFMDFATFARCWTGGELPADICPMPFGDGVVGIEDLSALSSMWLQQIEPAGLLAHWQFDESEGGVAHDRCGEHDGIVHGDPEWAPDEGMVGGALHLDGLDDYVETPFVLSPADGPFSIFAWVKTDTADKVIVSQAGASGVSWLAVDGAGRLISDLQGLGRGASPLPAGTVITDDQWHRVGFTWDGTHRTLYVDDVEVAVDTTPQGTTGAGGDLHIGADKTPSASSFFCGLIDDVRIYDRALKP